MIKEIKTIQTNACLQMTLEHPLAEIKEVSMYVFYLGEDNSYLFTIPFHKWSFLVPEGEEIQLCYGPGAFQQERYKDQLVNSMKQAITVMKEA